MRKILFVVGILAYMVAFGMETAHAQLVQLDDAIRNAAAELSAGITSGSRVAVLSIEAGSVSMSDYLIDEMIVAFIRTGGFTVVDRAQLDLVAQELHFQMSGEVDDATAQSIGRFMGVQSIVTGAFEPIGDFYRFIVRLIEVETAAIRRIYTANVQHDVVIASLLGAVGRGHTQVPHTAPRATGDRIRRNWMSGEVTALGAGLRYERDINYIFSVGGTAWFNLDELLSGEITFGLAATSRFFPRGTPFYLELGFGFGSIWDSGFIVVPAIGVRLGGRRMGFFANPFISIPMALSGDVSARFGIGLGGAW